MMRGEKMLENIFRSPKLDLIQKTMDASMLRQEAITSNMANVDTPNYKRNEVIFEEKLKKVLQNSKTCDKLVKTNVRHMDVYDDIVKMDSIEPELIKLNNLTYRNDGNNVDIDVETTQQTKNKIYYDYLAQSLSNEIKFLRMAITGRE